MRKNRYYGNRRPRNYNPDFNQYELLKAEWLRRHPRATPLAYENAMKLIAARCKI